MASSSLPPQRGWWDILDCPTRMNDPCIGMGLSDGDLLPLAFQRDLKLRPLPSAATFSGMPMVKNEQDKFKVMLNVNQFKPNEISVETRDNSVIIRGKHEEKIDEHGFISRQFTRRFLLPEGLEPKTIVSKISGDGVLTIEAPKKLLEPVENNVRIVPLTLEKPPVGTKQSSTPEGTLPSMF